MTTPERPSLADTLARIDAAIAERAAKLDAQPPCLRCARKSLIDSPYCAYHLPCPIDQARDEATAEVLRIVQHDFARHEREYLYGPQLDVRPRGGITENGKVLPWPPYLQPALDEVARHLSGPPGPTCPGCAARDARRGWLARTLRRLFT